MIHFAVRCCEGRTGEGGGGQRDGVASACERVEMWREAFAASPESSLQIVGDERLDAGECVLDTNVGRVELGVSAQLEEIERGFFDLMQQRPA